MPDYDNEPTGMGCTKSPDPRENGGKAGGEKGYANGGSKLARLRMLAESDDELTRNWAHDALMELKDKYR